MGRHTVARLDEIPGVKCPCGVSRRAFLDPEQGSVSLHVVDIEADAKLHYHKAMTEIYFVLSGEGHVEVDGERVPVRPLTAVRIPPGCRHRAVGALRIANICLPAFDGRDEWLD